MNNPILLVTEGLRKGTQLEINSQGIRIGRDPNNELHLDDPEVSRHHARVILHNGAVWVQDAGSRNGIFVNGNRVSGHKQISPGARIQIGTHQFLVQLPQLASDSSISVDLGSISTQRPPSNEPPKKLILGIGGAVCLLAIVGMLAMRKSNSPGPTGLPDANPVIAEATDNTENLSAADRLARSLEGADQEENIPDPPEGSSARELRNQAHELYQAGYFHDALIKYKQCTMLDQGMEICRARTDKLTAEIDKLKQEHYTSCLRYLEVQQYDQALASCEMVLQLEPNENAEIHKGAESGIVKAKAALNIDY
jgi:pSer/pThr/pTyr-binding forkhead associated (FHA) protein